MSKIICDVCGTSYPDTGTQCPICGCVRPGDAQVISGDTDDAGSAAGTYTYVKGGRFSKANVRKRNKANAAASVNAEPEQPEEEEQEERKSNKGLVIAAAILLLAIVAVVLYIALRFFMPDFIPNLSDKDPNVNMDSTGQTLEQTSDATVPCEGVSLDVSTITLDKAGSARMIYATVTPADTTDKIMYVSSNDTVAAVTDSGKVTAVGPGEATITVWCGIYSAECKVECTFVDETEDTTQDTTEQPTKTAAAVAEEFKLNRKDITFGSKGESWMLYDGSASVSVITWTSDDESVATIKDGKVVAVGGGMTTVYGEYNGQKAECIIRCAFSDASESTGISGSGGVSEDGGSSGAAASGTYSIRSDWGDASDVTIAAGSSLKLYLKDESGNTVSGVIWSSSNESCCTVSGGTVTSVAAGTVTITATYNGQTYSCTVRVS